MARCPDCNKFVSYDNFTEPEVDVDIAEGLVSGEIRLALACGEWGAELKETTFVVDIKLDEGHDGVGHELSVEARDAEMTTRQGAIDKKGKPIPPRYRRTYYGVAVDFQVSCVCGFSKDFEFKDELQASSFDDLT